MSGSADAGFPPGLATDDASSSNIRGDDLDESARLKDLQTEVRNQDDLERDIGREADRLLFQQATDRDQQRLDKSNVQKQKLQSQIRKLRDNISKPIGITQKARLRADIDRMQTQIEELDGDIAAIEERMIERAREAGQAESAGTSTSGRLPHESQRDFLIRTGKITPFSKFGRSAHGEPSENLQGALFDAEEEPLNAEPESFEGSSKPMSHRNLRKPGFAQDFTDSSNGEDLESDHPPKRRKLPAGRDSVRGKSSGQTSDSAWDGSSATSGVDEGTEISDDADSDAMPGTETAPKRGGRSRKKASDADDIEDLRGVDDGNESVYFSRVRKWAARRRRARKRVSKQTAGGNVRNTDSDEESETEFLDESHQPHPEIPDTEFDGGFKIPGDIYPSLFDYQKTGVQWLYELYIQQVGGIVGDEMGLGKTIQIISFLAGLHYSGKLTKPVVVVCPATVMKQWVNEFHRWWPPFRVTILHSSGSGMINLRNESKREDDLMNKRWDPSNRDRPLTSAQKGARKVLAPILEHGGVLVTTYSGLQSYAPLLIPVDWEYAILDEGHKIRNPDAAITIYCKELRTPNRIILSGTPMQNNLTELWSLFDFVFPMRLGTLVSFRTQFDIPIRQGGYANASNLQVQTAFKCAETLKDAISPYLLQRFKIDVAADLPKKSEQVLFCKLTKKQRGDYESFLKSGDMNAIMSGKRQVLFGIDILRKICNHPDLQDHKHLANKFGYTYGSPEKSGKMQVVGSLLELWKNTGHKALLFAQHRIMLDILEKYVRSMPGMKYRRMDGNTPIQTRQSMVDEFNTDPELHLFLLTTKVGGLGINLTGADRVIIYDPDWNPSTDLQARERAWRLGQKREVTIYRLMTAGTIEEKIYHRQIFKQFLTNKILKDPKQRQTFHLSDLHDLFTLGNEGQPTETSALFSDAQVEYSSSAATQNGAAPNIDSPRRQLENGDKDIQKVSGVASLEQYAGEVAEEAAANMKGGANSESRVMQGIFARSGVQSALEHDQIIGGGTKKTAVADPVLIEQEAKRIAAEAARKLRRAGEVARTIPAGTVTWTGTFGTAGRPAEASARSAFGSSSRNRATGAASGGLMAGVQNHLQVRTGSRDSTPGSISGTTTPMTSADRDFGKLIRDYLMAHDGTCFTQMLINHFNWMCSTPQATREFTETLKLIASMEKGSRGRARWVLKDEYRR